MLLYRDCIWPISASCTEYRYAVSRGGAVWSNLARQDLPCLLSIFPDIFVASSRECEPTQQTLATDEPRRTSLSNYSLIFDTQLCPWDESAGVKRRYSQPTHIGTVKNAVSARLRVIFCGKPHTNIHTLGTFNVCVEPSVGKRWSFQCNSAPMWEELAAATVNTAMGVSSWVRKVVFQIDFKAVHQLEQVIPAN